jgi:SOS-response transcriptional repressor LexA
MHVKDIRRKNLRALARSVGGVTKLAERLEKSQSQVSHLIGTNPIKKIGDKFAAHVEHIFSKPLGWLDHDHMGTEEEGATYQTSPARHTVHYVPFLSWQEVQQWLAKNELPTTKDSSHYIATNIKVSPLSFALRVEGDSMEATNGVSFCNGSIIIIDPELPIKNSTFVLAKQNASSPLVFKQLIIDGTRRFLKPLNHRYPITEINAHALICGVVRVMLMEFK